MPTQAAAHSLYSPNIYLFSYSLPVPSSIQSAINMIILPELGQVSPSCCSLPVLHQRPLGVERNMLSFQREEKTVPPEPAGATLSQLLGKFNKVRPATRDDLESLPLSALGKRSKLNATAYKNRQRKATHRNEKRSCWLPPPCCYWQLCNNKCFFVQPETMLLGVFGWY